MAGIIGLIGIVLNDALVWISFYNQLRATAINAMAAALETTEVRFRPICLTTLTTVLALLPAAISGAGVATDIARITVFGLLGSTLLLLFFFPLIVVGFERWHDKVHSIQRWIRLRIKKISFVALPGASVSADDQG